jgi:hypothetical protein
MPSGLDLLRAVEFNLDDAVAFAEASSKAYASNADIAAYCAGLGFAESTPFDSGDVQGYWCAAAGDVALLAFRGTSNPGQWIRDLRVWPVAHPWGHVHVGFSTGVAAVETALRAFDAAAATARVVWIVGHSLGGALAVLAAARMKINGVASQAALRVITFGQPAVGMSDFAERFAVEMPAHLWRVVNQSDPVTRVPPWPLFRHTGIVKRIVRPGVLEAVAASAAPGAPTTEAAAPNIALSRPTVLGPAHEARMALELTRRAPAPEAPGAPTPAHDEAVYQAKSFNAVVAGGAALTTAAAVASAGIQSPRLIDIEAPQMSEVEFAQLQLALRGATPGGPQPEGVIPLPWFGDHAIAEYIRLLTDIRDHHGPTP